MELTTKEIRRLDAMQRELNTISAEVDAIAEEQKTGYELLLQYAELTDINFIGEDTQTKYKNACSFLDKIIFSLNYIEDPDSKKGYSFKYDDRSAGTYCGTYKTVGYKGRLDTVPYYKDKLIDKFHNMLSLVFYNNFDLPIDFRPKAPTPCSACDLAESYWLTGEETDTEDE